MAKYGLNQVTLIGNLGKDPELRHTDQGIPWVSVRLACTESYRNRDGQNVDRTTWLSVNLWRGQAEILAKYCRKGSTVCIEGRLNSRSYETPQGESRTITEVEGRRLILLDRANTGSGAMSQPVSQVPPVGSPAPATGSPAGNPVSNESSSPKADASADDLDDLPF